MKKIILFIFLFFSLFSFFYTSSFSDYNESASVSDNLNNSLPSSLVGTKGDYKVEGEFKNQISSISKTLASVLSLIAVGIIAFAGFKMTITMGKEDDFKKSKDIIKWVIIGYLALISVGAIISIVINFVYGIGG